jgi:Sulfotransferase domain
MTNLSSIVDTHPDDIFIAGYPRSGNTWLQRLLAGMIFATDTRFTPDSLIQDLVPDVHDNTSYKRYVTPTFFKTHFLPQPSYRKVIHLVRDGRDAMTSYFHFLKTIGQSFDPVDLVSTGAGLFPCRWHEHCQAWLENPYSAQIITITYEQLSADAVAQLQRICEFAGVDREPSFLQSVVSHSSFQIMREIEAKLHLYDPTRPRDRYFNRRGVIGSHKDEMPTDVYDAFMRVSERSLRQFGYL